MYPDKKPVITFKIPSLEITGHTSCNGFGGKIILSGNKIQFTDMIQTFMACPGEGEQVFKKALEQVDSYKIENNTLLLNMNNVTMLRFVKKA